MSGNRYLDAMGIQVWKPRRDLPYAKQIEKEVEKEFLQEEQESTEVMHSEVETSSPVGVVDDWKTLQEKVATCSNCELYQTRNNTIFGVGNLQANWMIIGDAPNEEEESVGEPFVGLAGNMLNQMLLAIGVSREQVYIVNAFKCRPTNDREPKPEEIAHCESYLLQQINTIKPSVILAVGRVAAQSLLNTKESIGRLRENQYIFEKTNTPLVATFHPAYLLKSPLGKMKVWEDLVRAKKVIETQT